MALPLSHYHRSFMVLLYLQIYQQIHLDTFQALVQLSEASSAQLARQSLDGQNVYNGCCCLRIDYSKLATLNVKYNNDKSRDYTNPNLPSGELTLEQQLSLGTFFSVHILAKPCWHLQRIMNSASCKQL